MTLSPSCFCIGTSASLRTWDGWVQQLGTKHRVIRFDLPAFGLTGPRPDADYSIAAYVRFVVAMLMPRDRMCAGREFTGADRLPGTPR